ncbi:MAG TPA: hypothetical protein VJB96_04930 [Patescibacteria group bacterium]|nr:hypothetical protein [Patescibacteria group bacterium]
MADSASQFFRVLVERGPFIHNGETSPQHQRALVNAAITLIGNDQLDVAVEPYDALANHRKDVVRRALISNPVVREEMMEDA